MKSSASTQFPPTLCQLPCIDLYALDSLYFMLLCDTGKRPHKHFTFGRWHDTRPYQQRVQRETTRGRGLSSSSGGFLSGFYRVAASLSAGTSLSKVGRKPSGKHMPASHGLQLHPPPSEVQISILGGEGLFQVCSSLSTFLSLKAGSYSPHLHSCGGHQSSVAT